MKTKIYLIFDMVAQRFTGPFCFNTEAEAMREFVSFVKSDIPNVPYFDLSLYDSSYVLDFETGTIYQDEGVNPHIVCKASSIVKDEVKDE